MAVPPLNENFKAFAFDCWRRGVGVQSRYVGVYCKRAVKKVNGVVRYWSILWATKYERNGHKFIKHFPFTKEGEIAARKAYVAYLKKHGIKEFYKSKRKSNGMMTSNRYFEIWISTEARFAQASGDAYRIIEKLKELYDITYSKSSLYTIKKGAQRELTKKLPALPKDAFRANPFRVFVKCTR